MSVNTGTTFGADTDTTVSVLGTTIQAGNAADAVSTTIESIIDNTTTSRKFTVIIQTVTPPTVIVDDDNWWYTWYAWWFYSMLMLLFVLTMTWITIKLAQQNRQAQARKAAARAQAAQNGSSVSVSIPVAAATTVIPLGNPSEINNNNTALGGISDMPPTYDDAIQIVNAKLELQAAEEGAVGGMAGAISTSTLETNVDLGASSNDVSANTPGGITTPIMFPPFN